MKNITLIILVITGMASISAIMKDDGRAGSTGSPGETTCNTSQCHNSFTLNSGGGSIVITAPSMPGWQYVPGQIYPISVTVAKAGVSLFGLGFEALRSSGANAGTLGITNSMQTQIKTAVILGNSRTNVVHQLNGGASSGSHTFTFNWTAPVAGTGNVTLYTAGNAANANTNAAGDYIYTATQVVTEFTSGLDDPAANASLQVYPNPATANFSIRFSTKTSAKVEIRMLDTQGKNIEEIIFSPLSAGDHEFQHTISSAISPGIYFIELAVDGKRIIKRIAVL